MTKIIDGKAISEIIRQEIKRGTDDFIQQTGKKPGLAVILVGENPASQTYVGAKAKACEDVGFYSIVNRMDTNVSEKKLLDVITQYNEDPHIHGILVQLPLPKHIDPSKVIEHINYKKDVDGFHPVNVGRLVIGEPCFLPCTPAGIQELLVRSHIEISGKHVVVAGRSNIVGKPIANMLLQKSKAGNATVTMVHTGTPDTGLFMRQADILIAAIGIPHVVKAPMVKEGSVIIDVGINRIVDATKKSGFRLTGDVDYDDVFSKVSAITPVPGGVGPMTITMLLKNTLLSATNKIFS